MIEAESSNSRLSRSFLRDTENPGTSGQICENINGLRLLAGLPNIKRTVETSKWNSRAWTFQEHELSLRTLVYGKDQVYFQCPSSVFCEDIFTEVSDSTSRRRIILNTCFFGQDRGTSLGNSLAGPDHWYATHELYPDLVKSYTARSLTFDTDILAAFRGITNTLCDLTPSNWKFTNGLPEDIIDLALLWRRMVPLYRRFSSNGDPNASVLPNELAIPTYCWAAWIDSVEYPTTTQSIESLVPHFKLTDSTCKPRRVVRFVQEFGLGAAAGDRNSWKYDRDYTFATNFKQLFQPALLLDSGPKCMPQDRRWLDGVRRKYNVWISVVRTYAYTFGFRDDRPGAGNRPATLSFEAMSVNALLSGDNVGIQHDYPNNKEQCKRMYLLDKRKRRKIGWVWHVPMMDDMVGTEVPIIFLSKYPWSEEQERDALFDESLGKPYEDCMCNVMLITPLTGTSLSERLMIGKVHESCAPGMRSREQIMLV
ncbi:hypothetical protein MMC28_009176 [Mycoblastus sanguinarius]|nr:hypothetical protein [Mycoblastus sanguinarius]